MTHPLLAQTTCHLSTEILATVKVTVNQGDVFFALKSYFLTQNTLPLLEHLDTNFPTY
jgi:hypothetical protein